MCDSLAPCSHWGTGVNSIDHCHATDKDEYWKVERKHVKKGDKPKSDIHSAGGTRIESFLQSIQIQGRAPAQPNTLPQNQALNPVTIRPCTLSSNVSLPNATNRVRSQPSGHVAPRYNPRSQLVSVQSHPRSANIVAPKVGFRKSYHVGSQNPRSFPPRAFFKRNGLIGASTNNRHAYRFQLPLNRRPPAFQAPATNGHHGSNQQIVGSQAAVSSIPQPELSSHHNMDAGHANYLEPQINTQPCSTYRNPGSILHQSQTSSQPFVNGNSLSSPTIQPYIYAQSSVGNINNSVAPEPYIPYVPSNPLPSQTVASYQSDAGNTFADQLHSGSTISSHSSLGNEFDSGSSQLQEHGCPNSSLTCGKNDVQQHHTQSGLDASPADFGFFCDSSVNHGKMQTHAELPYRSAADILPRQCVELAAAYASPVHDADCQLPESKEPGSFDFNIFDTWAFGNQSFSGAVEASGSSNWNIYSPEHAFTDTGTLFDI